MLRELLKYKEQGLIRHIDTSIYETYLKYIDSISVCNGKVDDKSLAVFLSEIEKLKYTARIYYSETENCEYYILVTTDAY